MGVLPRSKPPSFGSTDGKHSSGAAMKLLVVAVCLLNAYYCLSSLRPSCPPVRQLLSSSEAAATAALEASSQQQLLASQLQQHQQALQQQALPTGTCAVKVEDISSWASAGLTEGPFHFPKIIHQTVEDKHNVSCESLACMQTWMDMNPGYEHRLVDAKERHEFVATYYPEVSSSRGTAAAWRQQQWQWQRQQLGGYCCDVGCAAGSCEVRWCAGLCWQPSCSGAACS